ncbi:MAG: hypothetical protein JNM84_26525 [Planctomycetes bacterium]|nr:hypothetical protein [Planctomycetota bacterium]
MTHEGTSAAATAIRAASSSAELGARSPLFPLAGAARTSIGLSLLALALGACSTSSSAPESSSSEELRQTSGLESSSVVAKSEEASAAGPQDPAGGMNAPQDDARLQEQVRSALARQAYEQARSDFERGELQNALSAADQATRYAPSNAEYAGLKTRIETALGRLGIGKGDLSAEAGKSAEIRAQLIREQAQLHLSEGKNALAIGDYAQAESKARNVIEYVKYAPVGDWAGIQTEAETLLSESIQRRQKAASAEKAERDRVVDERLKEWYEKNQERRRSEIAQLLEAGTRAFEQEQYEISLRYAEQILSVEPDNERALNLQLSSKKLQLDKNDKEYIKAKRARFREMRLQNDELKIPYTGTINMPDAKTFVENTERRKASFSNESPEDEAIVAELRRLLKETYVPGGPAPEGDEPKLSVGTLEDVINLVRNNPPVINGRPALVISAFSGDASELPELAQSYYHDLSLFDVLELAMVKANAENDGTAPRYAYQLLAQPAVMIRFTTIGGGEGSTDDAVLETYGVKDLTFKLNQFIAPDIGDITVAGSTAEGASPFGTIGEDSASLITGDQLDSYIQSTIAPGTWDGDRYSITRGGSDESPTTLLVRHRPEVQKQVREFLQNLKRTTTSLVTIESKFLTVSENFLQNFGVDFRGLGGVSGPLANLDDITNGLEDNASLGFDNNGSGLTTGAGQHPSSGIFFNDGSDGDVRARTENIFDNPLGQNLSATGGATFGITILDDTALSLVINAVEKSADFRIVNAQTLSVFNTQRSYITVVNQISYIQDFDVEVAQASFIADPVINVLQDGVVLDVRPVITQDRKHIILELRPTVATLRKPIPDFTTSLAGLTIPVTFQLPEMQVSAAKTTAVVPDGASILIGGLKTIRNVERKSEVPWIAKLPIVGILARQEGISDETENLMVLIKAYITDVEAELQRHLARN